MAGNHVGIASLSSLIQLMRPDQTGDWSFDNIRHIPANSLEAGTSPRQTLAPG
jgi:hypothetical protein